MRKNGNQKNVVRKIDRKLIKIVHTRFGVTVYISRATPDWQLKEVPSLIYFNDGLRENLIRHSERSSENSIDIGGWSCVVTQHPFLLACLVTYKHLSTSKYTVILKAVDIHFEKRKWTESFEKGTRNEELPIEMPNNSAFLIHLR